VHCHRNSAPLFSGGLPRRQQQTPRGRGLRATEFLALISSTFHNEAPNELPCRAYWGQRRESRQACASRISVFLHALAAQDAALSRWYKLLASRKEPLRELPRDVDGLLSQQIWKWGYDPSTVRAITYDANGNVYFGFR
jgi:hypothetical protein